MSKLEVNKQEVVNIYNNSTSEQKEVLKKVFGEFFDVRERVKTFEDACNELGKDHVFFKEYVLCQENGCSNDLIAYLKLRIITAALNEGWKPKFDDKEYRHYPWFCIYTKKAYKWLDDDEKKECRVVSRSHDNAYADTGVQSSMSGAFCNYRLVFKTRELAEYCEKQFIDIWEDYLFG